MGKTKNSVLKVRKDSAVYFFAAASFMCCRRSHVCKFASFSKAS